MKKIFVLITALAASCAAVVAAPLDSKGIPADAQGIVHIDLDLCGKTTLGTAIKQFSEKTLADKATKQEDYQRFKTQTGIDPSKDINSITLGIFSPVGDSRSPSAVSIVRGTFSPEKIIAAAKENKCPVTTRGTLTLIDLSNLTEKARTAAKDAESDGEEAAPAKSQSAFASVINKNTILIGETADVIEKAAAAFSGKTESYAPPAALDTFNKQEGASMVLAHFARGLTSSSSASSPISKAESVLVSIGEKGPNLHARIFSEYTTPEAARKTQAAVQMLVGFLQMGAANSESPEAEANAQSLQRLIESLKVNLNGKALDITADYPVAELVELMKKYNSAE